MDEYKRKKNRETEKACIGQRERGKEKRKKGSTKRAYALLIKEMKRERKMGREGELNLACRDGNKQFLLCQGGRVRGGEGIGETRLG